MRNIFLLGATGSIGTQVLDVIRKLGGFRILSLSIGKNIPLGEKIISEFAPEYVSIQEQKDLNYLKLRFPNIEFGYGEEGLVKAASYSDQDGVLLNAVVGMAGLKPTIAAIKKHRNILLANKETMVVAGDIINDLIKEYKVEVIPIDSEHSAIFQCLKSGLKSEVAKLIITASGGAFRNKSREELASVSVEAALMHPNWQMGKKITIDSATMVNKGLEVLEAHHLFGIDYDQIETLIHPESIIHSLVEFKDKSLIAQLSYPDMRLPIQYALTYPKRCEHPDLRSLDLTAVQNLTFKKMNFERFPTVALAYRVGRMGGIMPAVYNAANEVAVQLFLEQKISFLDIEAIINRSVETTVNITHPTLEEIIAADRDVRNRILDKYEVK
ncbi:MAG: 1-deoxy-D-xylulose-5-phosphate reductoisomerase [Acholeplasmataceae bacterium]|nr:1-deoxy-D-xylulose-5-phosphate reductoisomerase [Acholeplasmataceae bacterium]